MQVCIPEDWTDQQAIDFGEADNPCGTTYGWTVRTGERIREGDLERGPCEDREGYVHLVLDA
jgi:hypothetical protein